MNVEDIAMPTSKKSIPSTDTFEANFTGKRVIADGTHDTRDVIDDYKMQ